MLKPDTPAIFSINFQKSTVDDSTKISYTEQGDTDIKSIPNIPSSRRYNKCCTVTQQKIIQYIINIVSFLHITLKKTIICYIKYSAYSNGQLYAYNLTNIKILITVDYDKNVAR